MNIYHTNLDTTDFGFENQLMLEAQIKYALATDHTHVLDVNDFFFEITCEGDEITLTEIDSDYDNDSDEAVPEEHSIDEIIDQIIRNSLLSSEPITEVQARTMLTLNQLKNEYR